MTETGLFFLSSIFVWKIGSHWRNWRWEEKTRATFLPNMFPWSNSSENTMTATVLFIESYVNGNLHKLRYSCIRHIKYLIEYLFKTATNDCFYFYFYFFNFYFYSFVISVYMTGNRSVWGKLEYYICVYTCICVLCVCMHVQFIIRPHNCTIGALTAASKFK